LNEPQPILTKRKSDNYAFLQKNPGASEDSDHHDVEHQMPTRTAEITVATEPLRSKLRLAKTISLAHARKLLTEDTLIERSQ
jgi:hypothetical protein